MMRLEYEGQQFAWQYDSTYGCGQFISKTDGTETMLITGTDADDVRRQLNRLQSKTGSKRYPAQAPSFAEVFDSIASDYFAE